MGDGERVSERRLEGMEESLEWARARVKASFAGRVIVTRGLSRNVVSSEPSKRFEFMFYLVFLGFDVEREGRKTRKGGMKNEHEQIRPGREIRQTFRHRPCRDPTRPRGPSNCRGTRLNLWPNHLSSEQAQAQ